jgi:hypothetical protein
MDSRALGEGAFFCATLYLTKKQECILTSHHDESGPHISGRQTETESEIGTGGVSQPARRHDDASVAQNRHGQDDPHAWDHPSVSAANPFHRLQVDGRRRHRCVAPFSTVAH